MPLYEYQCTSCDKVFEVRQKFSDAPASECPDCGGAVRKLISQSGFSLKGHGWYGDGYSSANNKPAAASPCPSGGKCNGCPSAS